MFRFLFYYLPIIVIILLGIGIDQAFWRTLRHFLDRPAALAVRFGVMAIVVTSLICTYLYGHQRGRLSLNVNHLAIDCPRLPASFDGFRIAHISDFHLRSFSPDEGQEFIHNLAEQLKAERPDIICFTGDLVTIQSAELKPFIEPLADLTRQVGVPVYSVLGNHDYADYSHTFSKRERVIDRDTLRQYQEAIGWLLMRNEGLWLDRQGRTSSEGDHIVLLGVENIGEPPFFTYGDLGQAIDGAGGRGVIESTFCILLSHNPTHWRSEVIGQTPIDLTLSGHTHAFQCQIGNWSPVQYKYKEWSGLYSEGQQHLYVNTGLGCTGPLIRVGVAPELTIITLHAQRK